MDNNETNNVAGDPKGEKTTKRRGLRFVLRVVVTLTVLVAVGSAVVIYLARTEPTYWKEHQKLLNESTPEQLENLAEEVDSQIQALAALGLDANDREADAVTQSLNALVGSSKHDSSQNESAELEQDRVKPEDVLINVDQTITLNNEQLAAVMQTRMDDWMQERGYVKPDEITDPMIAVDDGNLVMAFELQAGTIAQVISGRFDLKIRDDGIAELTMERFLVGSLPIPANAIGEHLSSITTDDRAIKAGKWLEKLQYMQFKPVLELDNRRRARVQSYKLFDKGLELTVRVQDHKTYKLMNKALAGVPVD
jgi:uncharacterized protein YpmS